MNVTLSQFTDRRIRAEHAAQGHTRTAHARLRVDGRFFALGQRRVRLQGVTYGPFAPDQQGDPFPAAVQVARDFTQMRAAGINAVRTYHVPPTWLLEQAGQHGIGVLVDIPWRKHLCFLDSREARAEARQAVRRAAEQGRDHVSVLAYSIGNEISPSVVRWHGARRVERFLAELADVARQSDPGRLITYGSYPSTEYLDGSFLDFLTFNVYLHDRQTFCRYLARVQNLVGEKPFVLGELGMDTFRHGELAQAEFLAGHVREALLLGLAGAFVFSWTDDWFTGGHPIQDWAFGITHADRSPKAAYHALREVFEVAPSELLSQTPRVSVIVCSYNGGATLEPCLRSLLALDYPDYEVIVVDDGSTDQTPAILARFPTIRAIRQANHGLSVARNVGLQAATGDIVAYTDSDCCADRDWLTHLVHQLQRTGAAAVGGPNLAPEDGWLAACVAACPGQPMHVLESDQVAEHVPGCNMAFRRSALEALNGFDSQYRKAGDDVDICWRLQQPGLWITFAPGAFVWHHRRQTPRAYLRQQAGYGEAEALLQFKHPDRFDGRGNGKWRGQLYGASLQGLRLGQAIIYRGTFGTGLFQCIYQPGPAHWAMLPSTLEWHAAALLLALLGLLWSPAWALAAAMLVLSVAVAGVQAWQAVLARRHEGFRSRLLIMVLCYVQPLVRSCWRYRTRLFSYGPPRTAQGAANGQGMRMSLTGRHERHYWTEDGCERTVLLQAFVAHLLEHRWGTTLDSGWSAWDVEVSAHPWTRLQLCTAEENHGGTRRLIRTRYRLRWTPFARAVALAGAAACVLMGLVSPLAAAVAGGLCLALLSILWNWGLQLGSRAIASLDPLTEHLGLTRLHDPRRERRGRAFEQTRR